MRASLSRYVALATCVAAASLVPAAVQAAPVLDVTGSTGIFGNSKVTAGTFTDTYDLSAFGTGSLLFSGTISSSYQKGPHQAAQNIDFTSVSVNGKQFDIGTTGQFEFRTLTDASSTTKNILTVMGTSGSNASYSGTLNVAAVPEPATWAMLIGGIGMTGGAMRRKRQTTVSKVAFA